MKVPIVILTTSTKVKMNGNVWALKCLIIQPSVPHLPTHSPVLNHLQSRVLLMAFRDTPCLSPTSAYSPCKLIHSHCISKPFQSSNLHPVVLLPQQASYMLKVLSHFQPVTPHAPLTSPIFTACICDCRARFHVHVSGDNANSHTKVYPHAHISSFHNSETHITCPPFTALSSSFPT